jgi:hypothetical protein
VFDATQTTCVDILPIIGTFLRDQLGLPINPPRVFVYNDNWDIPRTDDMFVVVGELGADNYGQGNGYFPGVKDQEGQQPVMERSIVQQSVIVTVDLWSVSREARLRCPEVIALLQGDAAERLMDQYSIRIFRPDAFRDISKVEASRRLNRFTTHFAVFNGSGFSREVPSMTPTLPVKITVQP